MTPYKDPKPPAKNAADPAPAPEDAPKTKRVAPVSPHRSPIVAALVVSRDALAQSNADFRAKNDRIAETHVRLDALTRKLAEENRRADDRREREHARKAKR